MLIEPIPATGKNQGQSVETSLHLGHPPPSEGKGEKREDNSLDLSRMNELVKDLQQNMKLFHNVDLRFAVHKATGQIMVTVTDEDTGKVIREIPSSEMLNLSTKLEEMIGIIFDQKI